MYEIIKFIVAIVIVAMGAIGIDRIIRKRKNDVVCGIVILFLAALLGFATYFQCDVPINIKGDTVAEAIEVIKEKESQIKSRTREDTYEKYGQSYQCDYFGGHISYDEGFTEADIEKDVSEYLSYGNYRIEEVTPDIKCLVSDVRIRRNEIYLGIPEVCDGAVILYSNGARIVILIDSPTLKKEVDLLEIANALDVEETVSEFNTY